MKDQKVYIDSILECIENIETLTKDKTFAEVFDSLAIKLSIERCFITLGEAVKKLGPETKTQIGSKIPWKEMAGMRDILIHDYFDIDIKILWETIETDIPKLKQAISVYLTRT